MSQKTPYPVAISWDSNWDKLDGTEFDENNHLIVPPGKNTKVCPKLFVELRKS